MVQIEVVKVDRTCAIERGSREMRNADTRRLVAKVCIDMSMRMDGMMCPVIRHEEYPVETARAER